MSLLSLACVLTLFLVTPSLFLWMSNRYAWAGKIGTVALCYGAGLILGNSGLIPDTAVNLQKGLSEATIALALPMLLMTLNVHHWLRIAGKALISMLLATTAVVTLATLMFFATSDISSGAPEALQATVEHSQMAAMAVGVYTGGTPNLAAIKTGLSIPHENYLVFHTLDTLFGATYLILMLTVAIPVFRKLLPSPISVAQDSQLNSIDTAETLARYDDNYRPLLEKRNLSQLFITFLTAAGVVAAAMIISQWVEKSLAIHTSGALTIVLLTSGGIGLSFLAAIRKLDLAYKLGMYWIYVFCFTVASMADYDSLMSVDPLIVVFLTVTIIGSIALHALLCRLTGVDSDTFMVTSVAAICSPPFVPLMAKALGNSSLILSGMTTGIIGYALGNYLGISLALILQSL